MKKVIMIALIAIVSLTSQAQHFFTIGSGKLSVNHRSSYFELGYGYKVSNFVVSGGAKWNHNNYHLYHFEGGFQTKGRVLLSITEGFAWTANIPQQDRYYNPETGETIYLSKGYTTLGIWSGQTTALVGYRFVVGRDGDEFKDCEKVCAFVGYTSAWRFNWVGAGVRLELK